MADYAFIVSNRNAGAVHLPEEPFRNTHLRERSVRGRAPHGSRSALLRHRPPGERQGGHRRQCGSTATYPPAGFYSVDDYTPYGTKFSSSASSCLSLAATGQTVSLRDSFTGQEDQGPDFGLPYIDYGARQYSPALSRWLVPDPMGEKYCDISPYVYCFNNPLLFIDPTGKDGYRGSNGDYKWFENKSEKTSFVDKNKTKWTWVTGNRDAWNEAITIRKANINALVLMGNDMEQVSKDVQLYPESSPLFTKESHLLDYSKYIEQWHESINSDSMGSEAWASGELESSGYELKFYPQKNGDPTANSLGLVQIGPSHIFEAAIEFIERKLFGNNADNDPLYDMHLKNALGFLEWLKSKE